MGTEIGDAKKHARDRIARRWGPNRAAMGGSQPRTHHGTPLAVAAAGREHAIGCCGERAQPRHAGGCAVRAPLQGFPTPSLRQHRFVREPVVVVLRVMMMN